MIKITFPDNSVREYAKGTTAMQIAESISSRLAQEVLAASVNGEVWDLSRPINDDATVKLLKWEDEEGKHAFWHSSAHLMACLLYTSSGEVVKYLSDYISREPVDLFVVGLPKQMNNEPSENMKYVEAFVTHLKRTIPSIPVTYYDERFTSVLAHKAMLEGGLKKKKRQDKGLVDEISAVIILQAYLESKKYQL